MHHKSFGVETEKHKAQFALCDKLLEANASFILMRMLQCLQYMTQKKDYMVSGKFFHPLKRIDRKPSFNTTAIRRRVHKDART